MPCFYLIGYGSSNLLGNQGFGWWIPAILTFFYGVQKIDFQRLV